MFLPLILGGWIVLMAVNKSRAAITAYLIVASIIFYASTSVPFLLLLICLTLTTFIIGRLLLAGAPDITYWAGIAINLGTLGWYKYSGFLAENVNALTGFGLTVPAMMLPIGISFFTFQKIGYLTDIRRGQRSHYGFLDFTLLVWFFPQLMAGPLVRHSELIPQFSTLGRSRLWLNLCIGATLFIVGLSKKVLIADSCGVYADVVFDSATVTHPDLLTAWIGAISYSLQIYFDFSGYSDMAIGLARMFGLRLPLNFASPYQARSIIDFWRRWHITLSRFLRDYLYIPLGGNRSGLLGRYCNLMIVMLVGGLWHGAAWTFVLWGGLHGIYLTVNHLWRNAGIRQLGSGWAWALTFVAVTFAWVPFRAPGLDSALAIWQGMLGYHGVTLPNKLRGLLDWVGAGWLHFGDIREPFLVGDPEHKMQILFVALLIALLAPTPYELLWRLRPALGQMSVRSWPTLLRWRPTIWWALPLVAGLVASMILPGNANRFLYWQF